MLNRLHNWTMQFAYKPYASLVLFAVSFAESSFFPIPPDPLMMLITLLRPGKWLWYAFLTTLSSVLGAIAAYFLGIAFFETIGRPIIEAYHAEEAFAEVGLRYQEHAFLAIFGAAFTPIPFKVFTLAAGWFRVDFLAMVLASLLGRGVRFVAVAATMYFFGTHADKFIKKYFGLLTLAFFGLLVAGFVLVAYLF